MEGTSLQPRGLLEKAGLSDSMAFADFGSGHGFFCFGAATLTSGVIHALDVRRDVLDACKRDAQHKGLSNITAHHVNLEVVGGSGLADGSVDFVLMRKILSQNDDKKSLVKEAHRILRHGGKLFVIGLKPHAKIGASHDMRITQDALRSLVDSVGFQFKEEIVIDFDHYGVVFTKK